MLDIETVDRAFSTKQKAIEYVRFIYKNDPYWQSHPELFTDEDLEAAGWFNEVLFDVI